MQILKVRIMAKQKYIFDLDNLLYRDPADKYTKYQDAAAHTAIRCGVDLPFEQVHKLAGDSFKDHGSELTVFAEEFGIDYALLCETYHDEALRIFEPEIVALQELTDKFNEIAAEDKVVLTHSTSHWAIPVMKKIGIYDSTNPDHILAQDDPRINFKRKDEDKEPFEVALQLLGCEAKDAVMFDDTADNLVIPDLMGMETVFVHWGKERDPAPKGTQIQVEKFTSYFAPKP